MLVDQAIIEVFAGKGGDGALSFRREAYVPKGGPDGGNGGRGGNVYFEATPHVDTLLDMAGKHHWRAHSGQPGRGKSQFGKAGDDMTIRVPPGTLIYNDETGDLIADLDEINKTVLAAKGGKGGYGNEHFKSATNQTPRQFTCGEPGDELRIRLELKLIADIGLVGKPNAGKSTLLSALSAAHPKIADYPFTTLEPQLGIAKLSNHRSMVVADIPGLIEGAAAGAGLGHEFLRHIERTRILVHVMDIEPIDGTDPIENYHIIRRELEDYSSNLAEKPEIIALNKMDLHQTSEDRQTAVELIEAELGKKTIPISAVSKLGIQELLDLCYDRLHPSD